MHQPRPYGLFGAESATDEDEAFISSLMRNITNIKQTSGLESLRITRALPSGGVVLAMDMGGVFKAIVRKPPQEQHDESWYGGLTAEVPMLFSGRVVKSVVDFDEKPIIQITSQTQRRLRGYSAGTRDKNQQYDSGPRQSLERFKIRYAGRFGEFEPKTSSTRVHTQYTKLRAGWYSGAMADVVQIASGYGKSRFESKPRNPTELARMIIPADVKNAIAKEMGSALPPGYMGVPPETGQIQFDYKFSESHAVSFASDGKPWLLRINRRGVYAMPLPLIPATTTKAFRKWIEEVGDTEIQWILNRFGGMPSGEGFPKLRSEKAWERAGVIIKVCDMGDFYNNNAYSTAMGWSFNSRGSMAYNTCYAELDSGAQEGYLYCMTLQLGETKKKDITEPDRGANERVGQYMRNLMRSLNQDKDDGPAVRYKMRRSFELLMQRAKTTNGDDYEFWKNLELPKLAVHSGVVSKVNSGPLYSPLKPEVQPQFKFPEPLMDGCVSHVFSRHGATNCDTIMHAHFIGDDLKVVKYFFDGTLGAPSVDDNYGPCMTVGSWSSTSYDTPRSLRGNFYTTDFDDRKVASSSMTSVSIVGKDAGFSTTPGFEFDHLLSMVGTIYRKKYFTHKSHIETTGGYARDVAVCVPFYVRDSVIHVMRDIVSEGNTVDSLTLYSMRDPNSYRMFTFDKLFARVGGNSDGNAASIPVSSLQPTPKDGNPIWVTGHNYYPSTCTGVADGGNWMGSLPQDYTWLVHPDSSKWQHSKPDVGPQISSYAKSSAFTTPKESGHGNVSILEEPGTAHTHAPVIPWFYQSPHPRYGDFFRSATRIYAGTAKYASCDEGISNESSYKHWGYTKLADHRGSHCFIGVINE